MKSRTPSFVIELGLKTGEDQESALETYFSDARQLFNAVLGTAKKRVRAMKSTEAWKLTAAMPKGKDRNKRFKEIQKSAHLSEYARSIVDDHIDAGPLQQPGDGTEKVPRIKCSHFLEKRLVQNGPVAAAGVMPAAVKGIKAA